jgi:MraZ protein
MFAGEFPCKLDDKGRFAMPATLREHFTSPDHPEVKKAVLVKSQQEPCLWLFPVQYWREVLRLQQQRLSERESRLFMHYMVSDLSEVEIDRASRVLIPRKLREHARIGEDAMLVGLFDRLEIWGRDTWLAHLSQLEDEHEMSLSKVLQMPSIRPSFPGEQARL